MTSDLPPEVFGEDPDEAELDVLYTLERAQLTDEEQRFDDFSPGGERWDEEDLPRLFPRLAARVNWPTGGGA